MPARRMALSACALVICCTAAAADGSVGLTITDRLGRALPAAFSLPGRDGRVAVTSAAPDKPVQVPAGAWRIVPSADARLARDISVADGQKLDVAIKAADGVWVLADPDYQADAEWIL